MIKVVNLIVLHKHKNSKFLYYVKSLIMYCASKFICKIQLGEILSRLLEYDSKSIYDRVNYYNRLEHFAISHDMVLPLGFKFKKKVILFQKQSVLLYHCQCLRIIKYGGSAYFFDTYRYVRYFADSFKMAFRFGDVTDVTIAAIVKSRPVSEDNANSVVLNLDKSHQFVFLKDKKSFESKKNKLIGRGGVYQPHRIEFLKNILIILYAIWER
ncbi:hypothetical protein AGMMS49950_10650 [Endomicrobiia bacterium]|nr:hypothetical protein AGMMS49950_10650 [Endomicrobiia bacterium]